MRGAGAASTTPTAGAYVDGMASLWYSNVGYGRGEIADAVAAQMRTLAAYSCFDPFTNEPADELAELLATLAPVDRHPRLLHQLRAPRRSTRPSSWPASPRCRPATPSAR